VQIGACEALAELQTVADVGQSGFAATADNHSDISSFRVNDLRAVTDQNYREFNRTA
jgi:hypothetical protein